MTPHLTDMQVDLYLDEALAPEPRRAAQAHLAGCVVCRERLEALQPFFEDLEWLAVDVPEGFAPKVMTQLAEDRPTNGHEPVSLVYFLSAVQAAVGLSMISLAGSWLGDRLLSFPSDWPSTVAQRLAAGLQTLPHVLHRAIANLPDMLAYVWEWVRQARLPELQAIPDWRMVTRLAGLADVPDWSFGTDLPVQVPLILPPEQLVLAAAVASVAWLACNGVLLRGATPISHRVHQEV